MANLRHALHVFTVVLLTVFITNCGGGLESSNDDITVSAEDVSSGMLLDINPGVPAEVHTGWVKVNSALYFIANDNHEIWRSTTAGVATLLKDLTLSGSTTQLIADERTTSSATRFYFIVNGLQIWTGTSTTTAMVAELEDGTSVVSYAALGNNLYYQTSDDKVYKIVGSTAPVELTTAAASFSETVTFIPGTTTNMYFYGNHATNEIMYSHSGSAAAVTTVKALGTNATVSDTEIIGNNLYFQIDDSDGNEDDNEVYKSTGGVAAVQVMDDGGIEFAEDVTFIAGSTVMYMHGNDATDHTLYSHSGSAANATAVDALGANAVIGASAIVGDHLYYQIDDSDGDEDDNKVYKSLGGVAGAEVQTDANASFAEDVTFVAGTTIVYMHGNHASDHKVYSHTGAAATDATLVLTAGTNASVSAAATIGDNLYFQIEDTDTNENDERVYKSVSGVAAGFVYTTGTTQFSNNVEFAAGSTNMYIYGNDAANSVVYSHTGAVATAATRVLLGGTGIIQTAKTKIVSDTFFFHGRTTPVGLFASVAGVASVTVADFEPSQDDDYLCSVGYTPVHISSRLFFVANDGDHGCELWVTGGSATSTTRVADLNSGAAHAHPSDLTVVGTRLYFTALATTGGNRELYYTDSPYTSATKVTLTGADANPDLRFLTAVGSKLYFAADIGGDPILYAHSGSAAASKKQEAAGSTDLELDAAVDPSIVALGSVAIIRGTPTGTNNFELYSSSSTDAVAADATLIEEINAGASAEPTLSTVIYNGSLFFSADDGTNGVELWKTGGTAATTSMIANINQDDSGAADSSPENFTLVGTKVFFTAVDGGSMVDDKELWVSISPFTTVAKLTSYTSDSSIDNLIALGNFLIFTGSEDNATTAGIYRSSGTVGTTTRVFNGIPFADVPSFNSLYSVLNTTLFFVLDWAAGDFGSEIWSTQGTTATTGIMSDINLGAGDGVANHTDFAQVGGALVFVADDGTRGSELWYTNTSGDAPRQVSNINPDDAAGSAPELLGVTSDAAYYIIDNGVNGKTLYRLTN